MKTVPHHNHTANFYASGPLDRADKLRASSEDLKAVFYSDRARFIPVWRDQNLIKTEEYPTAFILDTLKPEIGEVSLSETVFLGLDTYQLPCFAIDVSHHDVPPEFHSTAMFDDLRRVGPLLSDHDAAILAYARGLIFWNKHHQYCGICGSPTHSRKGGHERRCSNSDCGAPHFPRTDPAVIMLVHDGKDHIVMGRQYDWPPGRCSVLAGFVEPGESLEDSVAREVFEEVGLEVCDIAYHSSQPWPFPSSIMLGFTAKAVTFDIKIDEEEIAEARWVSREEILNTPEDATFTLPRRDSIAYRLVQDWARKTG